MRKVMVLIILSILVLAACGDFGRVDQGRVIAYDKDKHTIVMIRDQSKEFGKTDYTALPPVTYQLPENPEETGPEPKVGKLVKMDLDNKLAALYLEPSNSIVKVNFTIVEEKVLDPKDPLVYDAATKKNKPFPVFDTQKKTITLYVKKKKTLATFTVPDEFFAMPPEQWTQGDEVRIYYKEEGKALRYMNVSKTDIFKK